jgi:acyl-CoA synthetase (AMP-forming)/AMP-acid ligase II
MPIFEPMSVNIGNLLARRANINGSIEALYDVAAGRRYTYAELNSETNKVASLLVDAGVKKGDRVAFELGRVHDCVFCHCQIGCGHRSVELATCSR